MTEQTRTEPTPEETEKLDEFLRLFRALTPSQKRRVLKFMREGLALSQTQEQVK